MKNKIIIIIILIIGIIYAFIYITPFTHFRYFILRKLGLRKPAKIENIIINDDNSISISIDKLDPGESLILPIPFSIKSDLEKKK